MKRSIRMGGWWRRIRLAGFKLWRMLWRPYRYDVTFTEVNTEEDVDIQIYRDSDRSYGLGTPLSTDVSGEATIKLAVDSYWYTASKEGFDDLDGDFEVVDQDVTETFELISTGG